jgi:predicted GTPase
MKSPTEISRSLKSTCSFLDNEQHSQILQDVELISKQIVDPNFRIAVLAPFNFGKSTLLNALLGAEVMPTKMIRTTGTAITIKYGKTQLINITLATGKVITSKDPTILKEFAVLDKKSRQRNDVTSVEVFYPHPLLKRGVELIDLPGTNDREEQDILVRNQMLQVDLVIQILSANQPFTMQENDILEQWLFERGITSVVFVLNWMNKLEAKDERNEVYKDVISATNGFRSKLPSGIKNLYRVDALPALRTKQNRHLFNISKRHGLTDFEIALHTIISLQNPRKHINRLPRVTAIAHQVKQALESQVETIESKVFKAEQERDAEISKGKTRENSLQELTQLLVLINTCSLLSRQYGYCLGEWSIFYLEI